MTFATSTDFQLHLTMAVLIVSLNLHDVFRPFGVGNDQANELHQFERYSLLTLTLTLWSGLLFTLDAFADPASVSSNAVVVGVILVNASYVGLLFVRFCMQFKKRQQKRIDKVSKLAGNIARRHTLGSKQEPKAKRLQGSVANQDITLHVEMTPTSLKNWGVASTGSDTPARARGGPMTTQHRKRFSVAAEMAF